MERQQSQPFKKIIMPFIDEIEALSTSLPLESIYVKEWKRSVYWSQLSAGELAIISKRVAADETPSYAVEIILLKALDESGVRLFTNKDAERLKRVKYQLTLNDIALKMQQRVTIDDAKEDFTKTPEN